VHGQSPSPDPGSEGQPVVISLGADQALGGRDLLRAAAWGLLQNASTRIEAADGGIRIGQEGKNGSDWTWRQPFEPVPVMRVGVDTAFERGRGEAGPMCGSAGDDPSFYGGIATAEGQWVVIRLEGNVLSVVARGELPGSPPANGTTTRLELECAVTGEGGDRIAMWVDGVNVADVTDATTVGPYTRPGLFAGVYGDRFQALFTDLAVKGGDAYAPAVSTDAGGPAASPDTPAPTPDGSGDPPPPTPAPTSVPVATAEAPTPPAVGALLQVVPSDIAASCQSVEPDLDSGQLEALLCVPGGSLEAAEYYRYDTLERLEAAFTRSVPAGVDVSGTDCSVSGAMVDYTVSGRPAGVLACYDNPRGGVTAQWTNRDLLVLAFGGSRSASFADVYAWWQAAGPIP
jgi:hypothetical protein